MRAPYFITLAQLDREHFIAGCRHGLVHLTWGRVTVRFRDEEFRRLVAVVAAAAIAPSPASFSDGPLRATTRPDEECELQMGPLVLLLPRNDLLRFAETAQEALHSLKELADSGGWRAEPEEPQPNLLEQLRRSLFSAN